MNEKNKTQPEPSMEEILASIRRMISDDAKIESISSENSAKGAANLRETVHELTNPIKKEKEGMHSDMAVSETEGLGVKNSFKDGLNANHDKTIFAQDSVDLEGLVKKSMNPMIKEWLDNNLPEIVERIVQQEIRRLSATVENNN